MTFSNERIGVVNHADRAFFMFFLLILTVGYKEDGYYVRVYLVSRSQNYPERKSKILFHLGGCTWYPLLI